MDWVEQAVRNLGHDATRSTSSSQLKNLFDTCDFVILGMKSLAGRWPNIEHTLSTRKCPAVYWWFDLVVTENGLPLEQQPIFKQFSNIYDACDICLVKERDYIESYKELGINAVYFDQGCPSNYPSVVESEKKWDLFVVGQGGHYKQRTRDVQEAVDNGFSVAWAGCNIAVKGVEHLPWTDAMELPKLASQARCVLSCGSRNDLDGYWSDQFWMATGMGACVLRRSTPGLPSGPYITYSNHEELLTALDWSRKCPDESKELGKLSRQWVMENHTIESRIRDIVELVRTVTTRDSSRHASVV